MAEAEGQVTETCLAEMQQKVLSEPGSVKNQVTRRTDSRDRVHVATGT